MKRLYISLFILFVLALNTFAQIADEDFFTIDRELRGVKSITETKLSKWKNVSSFDKEGFLIRKMNKFKNKARSDYRYTYTILDSLIEIKDEEVLNINNDTESYSIRKYFYNLQKQCSKFEVFSSTNIITPFVSGGNFIYKDDKLQSYDRHTDHSKKDGYLSRYIYTYSDNSCTKQIHDIYEDSIFTEECKSTSIYQDGKLIDLIHECNDDQAVLMGVICWSDSKMNKSHIHFSDFNKQGNWTRSYFITEKGKVFRSKRKIKYW